MEKEMHIAELDDVLIKEKVFVARGRKVIIDKDLAELYGIEAKRMNQAVKRNLERFPSDFMFELTKEEMEIRLRSQFVTLKMADNKDNFELGVASVTLKRGQHQKYQPLAFTEQGIAMLSSVLNSPKAVQINIQIIRIFTKMREMVDSYKELAGRIEQIEGLLSVLIKQEEKSKEKIGFDTGG